MNDEQTLGMARGVFEHWYQESLHGQWEVLEEDNRTEILSILRPIAGLNPAKGQKEYSLLSTKFQTKLDPQREEGKPSSQHENLKDRRGGQETLVRGEHDVLRLIDVMSKGSCFDREVDERQERVK